MRRTDVDVLVIGSGIAGLTYALKAAAHGTVHVITKKERAASSTNYAQGGIAAVMAEDDSPDLHVRDTLVAGGGLCHLRAVESLVREGPARVRDLIEWGVRFTRMREGLSLGREGGHSRRRVVHAGDLTGREIERALLQAVAEHPRITLVEDLQAIDLTVGRHAVTGERRCTGAIVLEHRTGRLHRFRAGIVLLATGGVGQAYRHTTNPDIATGDGVARAFRAGVPVANMEFMQFHPTALYPARERAFLIAEAVRGDGAVLRRMDGSLLMEGVHPMGSLAPRDVVARTIDLALRETGDPWVLLDLSPLDSSLIRERFPGILAECASRGFDLLRDPLPVVPAAHYACGGVVVGPDGGTALPGLYAAGEVAHTGVHGANRLASNSLLEAVVYSHRAAQRVVHELALAGEACADGPGDGEAVAGRPTRRVGDADPDVVRDRLRDLMWEDAGIVRSDDRLEAVAAELDELGAAALALFAERVDTRSIELRNLVEVATLIVRCARSRRESRGLHRTVDYPHRDNERCLRDTVVQRGRG